MDVIGNIPYRMAFAGGWIDQPFVSRLNPEPPGSMVVVGIEPDNYFMERSGMATGTRRVARRLWGDRIPAGDPAQLVRDLYAEENKDQAEPSGSQDMIGLIYAGVCRLDYDASHADGYFPVHIEQCCDRDVADWLERVIHMLPVAPRPNGYTKSLIHTPCFTKSMPLFICVRRVIMFIPPVRRLEPPSRPDFLRWTANRPF